MASWFCLAFAAVLWAHCNIQAHGLTAPGWAPNYKTDFEDYFKRFLNVRKTFVKDVEKDILDMATVLKYRLHKWEREDSFSFHEYHNGFFGEYKYELRDMYNLHLKMNKNLFNALIKHSYHNAAKVYFKANPYVFSDIKFKGENGDIETTIQIPNHGLEEVYSESAADGDYTFTQQDLRWAAGAVTNTTKYYRVKVPAHSTDEFQKLLFAEIHKKHYSFVPNKTDPLYHKVNVETLDQTQAAVVDFRMNLIRLIYASLLVDDGPVADFFPSMTNIQNTTRIYNPNMKRCIGGGGAYAHAGNCEPVSLVGNYYDWHFIEMATGDFVFRNIKLGTCLSYPHDPDEEDEENVRVKSVDCTYSDSNLWNIKEGAIMAKSRPGYYLTAVPLPVPLAPTFRVILKSKADQTSNPDSQTWSVSAPYLNSAVLTASYYQNSPPKEFIRNFPKILKAFFFKQSSFQGNNETINFFAGVKSLPYFAKLPGAIQKICNAASEGGSIRDTYKEMYLKFKTSPQSGTSLMDFQFGLRNVKKRQRYDQRLLSIGVGSEMRADYEEIRRSLIHYPLPEGEADPQNPCGDQLYVKDWSGTGGSNLGSSLYMASKCRELSDELQWKLLGKVNGDLSWLGQLQNNWNSTTAFDPLLFDRAWFKKPGEIRKFCSSGKCHYWMLKTRVFDEYTDQITGDWVGVGRYPKLPSSLKSDDNWAYLGPKRNGNLNLAAFTLYMNDLYLRNGLNDFLLLHQRRRPEVDWFDRPDISLRIIPRMHRREEEFLEQFMLFPNEILRHQSMFSPASLPSTTANAAFIALGEVFGLSRLEDRGVETIPSKVMINWDTSGLDTAFYRLSRMLNESGIFGQEVELPPNVILSQVLHPWQDQ